MNVSLPEKQIKEVDLVVSRYGYANRSEFVRSALRFALASEMATKVVTDFPFVIANQRDNPEDVVADFRATGKYSDSFLKDLDEGLKNSKKRN